MEVKVHGDAIDGDEWSVTEVKITTLKSLLAIRGLGGCFIFYNHLKRLTHIVQKWKL